MTAEKTFQDTPDHLSGATSSVGGFWPPEPGSFRRTKAIYNVGVIDDHHKLNNFGDEYLRHVMRLSNTEYIDSVNVPPTRIQFRSIIEGDILRGISGTNPLRNHVEAIIPLRNTNFGTDPVLVYFASNSMPRQPNVFDLDTVNKNVQDASLIKRRDVSEIISRAIDGGYQIEILTEKGESEVQQLAKLYERFGWDLDDVKTIVENPNNIFCVAKKSGIIVSSGIAECVSIPFSDSYLRIAEITEAATVEGHGGNGLYTAVSTSLLVRLASLSSSKSLGGEIDLVFGECNGLSLPVLKTAKIQGRQFATETSAEYGFEGKGILKQQVPISGPTRVTEYNDLVPAFLTRDKLYSYYLLNK